jgi:SM-20-related protein
MRCRIRFSSRPLISGEDGVDQPLCGISILNSLEEPDTVTSAVARDEALFSAMADDIERQGFSVRPAALPRSIAAALFAHQQSLDDHMYADAGVGRATDYLRNERVRSDEICWITGMSTAGRLWLDWSARLQTYLNRLLFLGLFSFESHFAHYPPGSFYKRHYDAFRGETNRILSIVVYLNEDWVEGDGGELVLYESDEDGTGTTVPPRFGTVALFLSEEFPHEVLPARRDRYSVAGWYRVNTSIQNAIDPPR